MADLPLIAVETDEQLLSRLGTDPEAWAKAYAVMPHDREQVDKLHLQLTAWFGAAIRAGRGERAVADLKNELSGDVVWAAAAMASVKDGPCSLLLGYGRSETEAIGAVFCKTAPGATVHAKLAMPIAAVVPIEPRAEVSVA